MSFARSSNSSSSKSIPKKIYDNGNDEGNDPLNDAKSRSESDEANKRKTPKLRTVGKKSLIFQIGMMLRRNISEPFQTLLKTTKSNMTSLRITNSRPLLETVNRRLTIIKNLAR